MLDSAVAAGAAPGLVLAVSNRGVRLVYGTGRLGQGQPERPNAQTLYDLASLTKVVALTTLAMFAVDERRLELDAPVQRYLPEFAGTGKDRVTIRHLLTHSSGLRAHRPLYLETASREAALALVNATPLDTAPGQRTLYSDLGAMVLTEVIERIYGNRIDALARARLFEPLGMRRTRYRPPKSWRRHIAPTERDPWRGRVLRGEVHDENAARLGGVSGHAGLFSSAEDLLRFGEWLLKQTGGLSDGRTGGGPSVYPSVVAEFFRRQDLVPGSSRALGWDTPSPGSSAGTRLSPGSIGHTGFTGTSIWLDPTHQLVIVLLSNRVHPTRENQRLGPLRAAVADRVLTTLYGDTATVLR